MHQSLSRTTLTVILLLVCLQGIASATVLYYPSQYATFNEAYNVAQPGDTIFIESFPPSYTSYNIGKCITLMGDNVNKPVLTDIGFIVNCPGGPDTCVHIKNLSFNVINQPGVYVITNCAVDSCEFYGSAGTSDSYYGGIRAYGNFAIRNCLFRDNANANASAIGGAISTGGGSGTGLIEFNLFTNNSAYFGGAIYVSGNPTPTIRNNTFVGNTATLGAAVFLNSSGLTSDFMTHNIFADNAGGPVVYNQASWCPFGKCNDFSPDESNLVATSSGDCGSPTGINDCIVADPLFCGAPAGDFTLDCTSPCLNAPGCGQIGALGQGCCNSPTAFIDNIIPNPAGVGETVCFTGHGIDPNGTVIGYSWRSDIDGQLSTQASFCSSSLSVGQHTIYFKVKDNDDNWSPEVSQTLEIIGCGDLGFRPNPDGWRFGNPDGIVWSEPPDYTNAIMWPQTWWQQFDYADAQYPFLWRFLCNSSDFPDWPLFASAFGQDQCYWNPPPGLIIYKSSAVSRWLAMKGNWSGSCFGFAISTFLFFDDYLDVATEFPGSIDLYDVPIGDESRSMVNKYWIYQFGRAQQRHISNNYGQTTPNQTLQACLDMFNSSASPRNDRIMGFFNNHGYGGHAVNPYRCEVDGSNSDLTHVYIYDNNAPNDETRRITFNTGSNTWSYANMSTWGGSQNIFLMDPISNYTSNPVLPKDIPPKERWISEEKSINSEYVEFYFPSADTVRIESSLGEIGQIGDSLFSNLSDGCPIIPITGEETPPIGYFLPNAEWAVRITNQGDSTFRLSVFADSTVIVYHRENIEYEDVELFRYLGNDSSLSVYNVNQESISYSLDVISVMPDSEIVCGIRNISTAITDSVRYSISSLSGLHIDNYGVPTSYAVRLQIVGANTDTAFYHDNVMIESNTTHSIVPDWRQHGDSVLVLADVGMTGEFSDTLALVNEGEPPTFICGDINGDGSPGVDISDLVYLVDYMFNGGPEPPVMQAADVDGSGDIDISDLVYLVDYMFTGGPPPACP